MLLLCRQTNTIPTRRLGGCWLHCHNVQANKHPAEASQAQLRSTTKQGALHHLGLAIWDLAGGNRPGWEGLGKQTRPMWPRGRRHSTSAHHMCVLPRFLVPGSCTFGLQDRVPGCHVRRLVEKSSEKDSERYKKRFRLDYHFGRLGNLEIP